MTKNPQIFRLTGGHELHRGAYPGSVGVIHFIDPYVVSPDP